MKKSVPYNLFLLTRKHSHNSERPYLLSPSVIFYIRIAACTLASIVTFSSCTQPVESPDADISKDAFTIYGKFLTMTDNAATTPYASRKKSYQEIQDSIQVLKLRAYVSTNPHDNAVVDQAAKLSQAFASMQHQDQSGWGKDKAGVEEAIKGWRDSITQNISHLLEHQAVIKELSSASGSSSPTTAPTPP